MTGSASGRQCLRPSSGRSGLALLDHCLLRRSGGTAGGTGRPVGPTWLGCPARVTLTHPPDRNIIVVVPPKVAPYSWPNGGPLFVASDIPLGREAMGAECR